VRIAGKGVEDQDRIAPRGVQMAPRFIGYVHRGKDDAGVQNQRRELDQLYRLFAHSNRLQRLFRDRHLVCSTILSWRGSY
jgi:hypothetical protein